jgi:hypothetical protein
VSGAKLRRVSPVAGFIVAMDMAGYRLRLGGQRTEP